MEYGTYKRKKKKTTRWDKAIGCCCRVLWGKERDYSAHSQPQSNQTKHLSVIRSSLWLYNLYDLMEIESVSTPRRKSCPSPLLPQVGKILTKYVNKPASIYSIEIGWEEGRESRLNGCYILSAQLSSLEYPLATVPIDRRWSMINTQTFLSTVQSSGSA